MTRRVAASSVAAVGAKSEALKEVLVLDFDDAVLGMEGEDDFQFDI